jgi:hypothetical protein
MFPGGCHVGDGVLRLDQHVDHGLGPGGVVPGVLGDRDQLAEDVRPAQGLGLTVNGVRGRLMVG